MYSKLNVLLLVVILFTANTSYSNNDTIKFETDLLGGFGINMVDRQYVFFSTNITWHTNEHFDLSGGIQYRYLSVSSFEYVQTIKFPNKKGAWLLENRYLYQMWTKYNIHVFNPVLTLGYNTKQWKIQIGIFNKFYSNINNPFKNVSYIFEPLNFAYNAEVWILPFDWQPNVGLRLSNAEEFIIERAYSPIFTIKLKYTLRNNWIITGSIKDHPSGIFDLTKNFFERTFQIGIKKLW